MNLVVLMHVLLIVNGDGCWEDGQRLLGLGAILRGSAV